MDAFFISMRDFISHSNGSHDDILMHICNVYWSYLAPSALSSPFAFLLKPFLFSASPLCSHAFAVVDPMCFPLTGAPV